MRKIVYGKARPDGYRNFHIVTRGGSCYGRIYEGTEWAYVHYTSHADGTTYMQDVPQKVLMAVVRGKMNWASFESECRYWWQEAQEEMERLQEEDEEDMDA